MIRQTRYEQSWCGTRHWEQYRGGTREDLLEHPRRSVMVDMVGWRHDDTPHLRDVRKAVLMTLEEGGRVQVSTNLDRLVLGCIEANICK